MLISGATSTHQLVAKNLKDFHADFSANSLVILVETFILDTLIGFNLVSPARKGDHDYKTIAARSGHRLYFRVGMLVFPLYRRK
jgi:hypothetical protein